MKFKDLQVNEVFNTKDARWVKLTSETAMCMSSAIVHEGTQVSIHQDLDVIPLRPNSSLLHIECVATSRLGVKKYISVPQEVATIGRNIKVQGKEGWKITEILGQPEEKPEPFKDGP